jgi:hypothetical protein
MGLLRENLLASHLHALGRHSGVRVYFWREKDLEVDLIYDHPEHPVAFEVASSAGHRGRNLVRFMERFPKFSGRCFLVYPEAQIRLPESESSKIGTISLELLLLALSAQCDRLISEQLNGGQAN